MITSCQILSLQSRTQQNLTWACVKMLDCTQETDWRIKNSPPTVEDYCSGLQGNYPVSNFNRIFCNLTNIYGYFFKAIKLLCWKNAAGAPAARTNFVDFFSHFHAWPFTPEWDLLRYSPDNVNPVCVCVCVLIILKSLCIMCLAFYLLSAVFYVMVTLLRQFCPHYSRERFCFPPVGILLGWVIVPVHR